MINVLEIEKLTVSLPKNADRLYAIEDINLIVNRNEIVCVVGESGSGKSCLLYTSPSPRD